jgi:hypothetical protein
MFRRCALGWPAGASDARVPAGCGRANARAFGKKDDKTGRTEEMTQEATTSLESADIREIMKLLPHRYPFLLVDRIIEIDADNSAIGLKNVTASEPHFTGHFPGNPIMPGVLIIEGMAQTAGAICAKATKGAATIWSTS